MPGDRAPTDGPTIRRGTRLHSSPEAWLQRFQPRPQADVRLFCFPHAGGAAAAYRPWSLALPAHVDVVAVQPPGRGGRFRETPLDSIPALVEALLPAIETQLDRPFAFFGHSMGATFAHAVADALRARGGPQPFHLFVSARRPPWMPDPRAPMHRLSDDDFVAEMNRRYGGIPPEVLAEKDLLALLLPCVRADIRALETWQPAPGTPLDVPVSAFGGLGDALVPLAQLEAWREATRAGFALRQFPGGHFYLEGARGALFDELLAAIARFREEARV